MFGKEKVNLKLSDVGNPNIAKLDLVTCKQLIPRSIIAANLCNHCYFKTDRSFCECFGIGLGNGKICDRKIRWLSIFIDDPDNPPSIDDFALKLRKFYGNDKLLHINHLVTTYRREMDESDPDSPEYKRSFKEYKYWHREWVYLYKLLLMSDDLAVSRSTTKKLDVTSQKVVRPSDVAKVIEGGKVES